MNCLSTNERGAVGKVGPDLAWRHVGPNLAWCHSQGQNFMALVNKRKRAPGHKAWFKHERTWQIGHVVTSKDGTREAWFEPTYGKYGAYQYSFIEGDSFRMDRWQMLFARAVEIVNIPLPLVEIIARYIWAKDHCDYWLLM